jgi:hypothetical protein
MRKIDTDAILIQLPDDAHRLDKCVAYINENDFEHLRIVSNSWDAVRNPVTRDVRVKKYDEEYSLDFLKGIGTPLKVKKLVISGKFRDYHNLYAFAGIEELLVAPKNGEIIDLDNFRELKDLSCGELSGFRNLENAGLLKFGSSDKKIDYEKVARIGTLEELGVYDDDNFTFDKIKKLCNLKVLVAKILKIRNMAGIECLKKLEVLNLMYCRTLENIDGIEKCADLRSLYLANLPKITDIRGLAGCASLVELTLDTMKNCDITRIGQAKTLQRLSVENCGAIGTLAFLNDMDNLIDFALIDTTVLDGDLTPCLRLKNARVYPDKRNNNLKDSRLPKATTKFTPQRTAIFEPYEVDLSGAKHLFRGDK